MGGNRVPSLASVTVVALLLAGCDTLAGGSEPSDEDVIAALQPFAPNIPFVDASARACRKGAVGDANSGSAGEALVCDICAVSIEMQMVGDQFSGGGTHLVAERSYANVAFVKAVSTEQPAIRPARGERGVWVIDPTSVRPITGADISSQFSVELENRAGFQSQTGFNAGFGMMGGLPSAVVSRFAADPQLRRDAAAVVGDCKKNAVPNIDNDSVG